MEFQGGRPVPSYIRIMGVTRIGGGDFFSIMNALKKQEWLMRNVAAWILYDSDDSDSPDDLIVHYARKRTVGHKTSVPVGSR